MTWEGLTPPYATIVADPPWPYNNKRPLSPRTQPGGAMRKHYPAADSAYSTLTFQDIAAFPVADLAAKNAHLYLWVTTPLLFGNRKSGGPAPVDVLEAWGFSYVTVVTWAKIGRLGMGFYFRGSTEHLLFGIRGDAPIPPAERIPNLIVAKAHDHSVKPAAAFDLAERLSPGPYLELFCRQQRFGWDSWGWGYEHAVTGA